MQLWLNLTFINFFKILFCFNVKFQDNQKANYARKFVFTAVSTVGLFFNVIEMICYAIFFHYLTYHNNNIAVHVLQPSIIKQRNQSNAISMLGLFVTWIIGICYITTVGLVTTLNEAEWLREYASTFKDIDFVWIPWIEILTSVSIKEFVKRHQSHSE